MADATPEELAAAGVEMGDPQAGAEPPRVPFEEVDNLPNEPASDVKIVLATGEVFRERLLRVPIAAEGNAPDGFNFSISNALLDDNDQVVTGPDGIKQIVPPEVRHELRMKGEDMAAMGAEGIAGSLLVAREVAAARARDYFAGMAAGTAIFASRLG